jgi:hypothetical protein
MTRSGDNEVSSIDSTIATQESSTYFPILEPSEQSTVIIEWNSDVAKPKGILLNHNQLFFTVLHFMIGVMAGQLIMLIALDTVEEPINNNFTGRPS